MTIQIPESQKPKLRDTSTECPEEMTTEIE
jgi:hypothetical protein